MPTKISVPLSERRLLRVEEFAALNAIGRSTVFEMIKQNQVESVKIGRSRRIVNTPNQFQSAA